MNINNVPLLPALVKRAKDAARVVKDGVHVAIHQVTDNVLTHFLDLLHFEVTGYAVEKERSGDIVHLFAALPSRWVFAPTVRRCPVKSSNTKNAVYETTTFAANGRSYIFGYAVLNVLIAAFVSLKNWPPLVGVGDKRNDLSRSSINNVSAAAKKKQPSSFG